MPLLSVIIPIFNSKPYLKACINSVISHNEIDIEFILVDDGSTDGSGEIADSFAMLDNRIRVYHQENGGVSRARNYGMKISKGEYLYFIDSDDICLVDDFSFLKDHKDLFIGKYAVGNEYKHKNVLSDISVSEPVTLSYLKGDVNIQIGSLVIAKKIALDYMIFFPEDIKYGEDQEFLLKILCHSKNIEFQDKLFVLYRTNHSSAMYKITLSKFDVVISRINLIDYFEKTDKTTSDFLRDHAVLESLRSVCEDLFRHGMSFYEVFQFVKSNNEIRSYHKKYANSIVNDDIRLMSSLMALRSLQFEVLYDKMIYNFRRKASTIKGNFLRWIFETK